MKLGFFGALALLLIALKLTGVITASWGWVLLPIYFFPALIFIILLIAGCMAAKP